MAVLYIVLGVAVLVVIWRVDLNFHPFKPCPSCGGRTRNAGSRPAAWGHNDCRRCGNKREVRRWGAPAERGR